MTNSTYTELETAAIKAFASFFNYDDAESEIDDNCTPFDVSDLATETNQSVPTIKGVIGSLTKKGLVDVWEGGSCDTPDCLYVTEEGILAYYSIFN